MSRIIISYRREDAGGYTGRIFDRLQPAFPDTVFRDIDSLVPGVDFVKAIQRAVQDADILIAVIGPRWKGTDANPRIHDPEDFVRIEVAAALERGIRVIPVLVAGATMPRPEDLPDDLIGLTTRHALEIADARFHSDADRLIKAVREGLEGRGRERTIGKGWKRLLRPLPILTFAVGTAITIGVMQFSRRSEVTAIPDVIGLAVVDARDRLTQEGYAAGSEITEDSDQPEGVVLRSDPPAGEEVAAGTAVTLYVSEGPDLVVIPDLSGETLAQAGIRLALVDIGVDEQISEFSSTVPEGAVVRTQPDAGQRVSPNSRVTVYVSMGPRPVVVPAVDGLTQDEAVNLLSSNTLALGAAIFPYSDFVPSGQVIRTNPSAGESVPPNTSVTVYVSMGPQPSEGTLRFTVSPDFAQVQIDNQAAQGQTHSLPPGRHLVTASAAGYESFSRDIRIVVGETFRLEITLEEETIVTQCETFNATDYNADGSCFDAQPRPRAATLVPLTPEILGRPQPATLAIKVNTDGTVALVLTIAPSDDAAFTQAALVFAGSIEYNPAQKNGQAVVGWTQQVFHPGRRQ